MPSYDPNNIFAKILRGELPAHKVYEDDKAFAFLDIMVMPAAVQRSGCEYCRAAISRGSEIFSSGLRVQEKCTITNIQH